jgi:1-phosphofructokinase
MIVTVTLNPAVDKTVEIKDLKVGDVNRVSSVRLDAAGKGINVSKVIKTLGGESRAIGILAGNTGDFIKKQLDELGIQNEFITVRGETRTNIKVVDIEKQITTEINESGPFIPDDEMEIIKDKIIKSIPENSVAVFSGSAPRNVNKDIYRELIIEAKKKGVKCILDASKELLREGIEAGPYLIKPNIHELEEIFGVTLGSYKSVIKCIDRFFQYGIENVVVSLGKDGSLFITKDKAIHIKGMKVDVKSTVGAGDSMVAALAFAIEKELTLEDTIRLMSATSTASVMTEGTQPGDIEIINQLKSKIQYEFIR